MLNNSMTSQSTPLRTPSYLGDLQDAEGIMDEIRTELYKHHPDAVVEACGLSKSTVMAIRRGTTKWPRPKTFFSILKFLGLRMRLVRNN